MATDVSCVVVVAMPRIKTPKFRQGSFDTNSSDINTSQVYGAYKPHGSGRQKAAMPRDRRPNSTNSNRTRPEWEAPRFWMTSRAAMTACQPLSRYGRSRVGLVCDQATARVGNSSRCRLYWQSCSHWRQFDARRR